MQSITIEDHGSRNVVKYPADAILDNVRVIFRGDDNLVTIERSCLNNVVIDVEGSQNVYEFVEDCCVCNFRIRSRVAMHSVRAADRTRLLIGRAVQIEEGSAIFEADDTRIEIHHATTIVNASFYAAERDTSIVVHERCLFSWNIDVRSSDWHSVYERNSGERINYPKSVTIGPRTWVGSDVRILKGVEVGEGSVIGVGSIVTKSVPAYCAVAGNPARVVRENICWDHGAEKKAPVDQTAA